MIHEGTNTYLLGTGRERLLIDTGEGKAVWREQLSSVLKEEQALITHVLLTHWHVDHVSGVKDLLELCPDSEIYKNQPSASQHDIPDGCFFRTEGATLRSVHSPGHTVDHTVFVLKEEDAMFTGDNVLGHGTAVFENLSVYLDSLKNMRQHFAGRAYPGHGEVIDDGVSRIDEYIAHRQSREDQVLQLLGDGKPRTPMELVKIIYKDVPENLHEPAAHGVLQILQKLEGEGKVVSLNDGRWRIAKKASL